MCCRTSESHTLKSSRYSVKLECISDKVCVPTRWMNIHYTIQPSTILSYVNVNCLFVINNVDPTTCFRKKLNYSELIYLVFFSLINMDRGIINLHNTRISWTLVSNIFVFYLHFLNFFLFVRVNFSLLVLLSIFTPFFLHIF